MTSETRNRRFYKVKPETRNRRCYRYCAAASVAMFVYIAHSCLRMSLDVIPSMLYYEARIHPQNDKYATCSGRRRSHVAKPTNETKVTAENRARFVREGLYENIGKGSGSYHVAGVVLHTMSQVQHSKLGIFGTVGEIGVHHGRFTSFLYMTAQETEPLIAVDLFEALQDENVDMSGMGSLKRFVESLSLYGLGESDVQTFTTSSLDLDVEGSSWLADKPGIRLLSVDGGHTAEITRNDLRLAFCNLLPGGIVVLDDWFNPPWPGVVEGFFQFANLDNHIGLNDHAASAAAAAEPQVVYPFLLCENKLYLTNDREAHDLFLQTILNDPFLGQWVSMYAKVGHIRARSWPYFMVNGTRYVRCRTKTELPLANHTRAVWLERLETTSDAETAIKKAALAPPRNST
ncbi:hypothetical protein ACA910_004025 [Epithemia clementina (nom. ined.)]